MDQNMLIHMLQLGYVGGITMNRIIDYTIDQASSGLRVEQYLRRRGYSGQNLTEIKRMPESILVNGIHYYMRQTLAAGDHLRVRICETECSGKIPPTNLPLDIVYEDEDIVVINKPAGMPIHPSMNNYTNSMANALAWYYREQGSLLSSAAVTAWTATPQALPLLPSIWSAAASSPIWSAGAGSAGSILPSCAGI